MFITANGMAINDGAAVMNGRGMGDVGQTLQGIYFDPGLARPYLAENGEICVTANTGKLKFNPETGKREPVRKAYAVRQLKERGMNHPTWNLISNVTALRKEEWIELDRRVIKARRNRIQAWPDLTRRNSVSGFNAMGKMTYEYEAMTDPGEAVVDMDAITDGRNDAPQFKLRSVPLPITHSDWSYSERMRAVSSNGGSPLGSTMAEACSRRVAEMVERTTIGVETGTTYGTQTAGVGTHDGTSTNYGYINFPQRVTKTDLTAPTGSNPEAVLTDILEMIETMQTNGYYGPYTLYHSTGYTRYLGDDYFRTGSTSAVRSLRARLVEMPELQDIIRLDFLTTGFQLILVQHDAEVVEAINGMEPTIVQWVEKGGLQLCFKLIAIQLALFKSPYNGVSGVLHGTTS